MVLFYRDQFFADRNTFYGTGRALGGLDYLQLGRLVYHGAVDARNLLLTQRCSVAYADSRNAGEGFGRILTHGKKRV